MVYIRETGPYAVSSRVAWAKVMDWLDKSGMRRDVGCGYGLLLDDPNVTDDDKCRYDACLEMLSEYNETLTDEFQFRRLPGGAYVRQRFKGSAEELRVGVMQFRDENVPMQGLVVDRSRPMVEIYLDDPDKVAEADRTIDICIPVRAQGEEEDAAA